jgi:hypothetical protein
MKHYVVKLWNISAAHSSRKIKSLPENWIWHYSNVSSNAALPVKQFLAKNTSTSVEVPIVLI